MKEYEEQWKILGYQKELWVHKFIHSLDVIPQAWYLTEERKRGINTWQEVTGKFTQCFLFEGRIEPVTQVLQAIKRVLFFPENQEKDEQPFVNQSIRKSVACKKINSEMDDDDLEGLRDVYFKETEGYLGKPDNRWNSFAPPQN